MSIPVSQFIPHSPPPSCAHMSFHYIWISIPALQIGHLYYFFLDSIYIHCYSISKSCWLFATPWTAAPQASQSFTTSWSFLKLMLLELVIWSNYFILCCLLLQLLSIFSSIRIFFQWVSSLHQVAKILIAYGEQCQICDLRRRFSFGTKDQAWSLRAFVWQRLYDSDKGERKLLT